MGDILNFDEHKEVAHDCGFFEGGAFLDGGDVIPGGVLIERGTEVAEAARELSRFITSLNLTEGTQEYLVELTARLVDTVEMCAFVTGHRLANTAPETEGAPLDNHAATYSSSLGLLRAIQNLMQHTIALGMTPATWGQSEDVLAEVVVESYLNGRREGLKELREATA